MNEQALITRVEKLYQKSYLCELQLGFEPEIEVPTKWKMLDCYADAGFTLVSLALATDVTSLERTIQFIAKVREYIQAQEHLILVKTDQDIYRAKAENKLAITFLLQGPNPLAKDLAMVDLYYQLGVRSMILAYNIRNPFGDGCTEPKDAGLSRLGKRLIKKMNAVGMIIDCSHTGYHTSLEAMSLSESPVIFSHSNVYSLCPHPRNLKDEQIKACAETGGVIGINGNGVLLGNQQADVEKYVEHLDYIAQLVGVEHAAIGMDLVYFPEYFEEYMRQQAIFYSDDYLKGTRFQQWPSIKPEQIQSIIQQLLTRGYSEKDIQLILGENYLRVIKQVWK